MTLGAGLRGRSALVTGASGGLGVAIVRLLRDHGVRVVAADRAEPSEGLRALQDEHPDDVVVTAADLSVPEGATAAVTATVEAFDGIDLLVNNAGGGIVQPFLDHDPASMQETLARNLWTTVLCCHVALPHMVAAGFGRIVNVGAESVRNGLYNHAMYNAAKGGVHGLTTGLAREFATDGITVNVVAPAGIRTDAIAARTGPQWEAFRDRVLATIPMARLAEVEEVAATVAFLLTDEAAYVTGQVISVNGGSSMS